MLRVTSRSPYVERPLSQSGYFRLGHVAECQMRFLTGVELSNRKAALREYPQTLQSSRS